MILKISENKMSLVLTNPTESATVNSPTTVVEANPAKAHSKNALWFWAHKGASESNSGVVDAMIDGAETMEFP